MISHFSTKSIINFKVYFLFTIFLIPFICCVVAGTLLDSYDQPFEGRRLGFAVMGISGQLRKIVEYKDNK